MDRKQKMEAVHLAEAAVSTLDSFIQSIENDEIKRSFETLRDSHSAKLLTLLPIMIVMQAMQTDQIISREQYSEAIAGIVQGKMSALHASQSLLVIHLKRLQGEDFFNGKEI